MEIQLMKWFPHFTFREKMLLSAMEVEMFGELFMQIIINKSSHSDSLVYYR